MANGFPVAMVAGNDEMMGLMEDGTVMHGGTVNTNVMCMAAADVCLRKLAEEDGAVYDQPPINRACADGRPAREGLEARDLAGRSPARVPTSTSRSWTSRSYPATTDSRSTSDSRSTTASALGCSKGASVS